MAADTDRLVGKAMYLTLGAISLKITKATPKVSPKFGDTTDSGDYDPATDLLYPTQIQVTAPVEFAVEGNYRVSVTPTAIIAKLFDGTAGPQAVTFGPKSGHAQFSGNYNISDYNQDTACDDVVKFSCTLKSNGKVFPAAATEP